jgi:hypothetical protein
MRLKRIISVSLVFVWLLGGLEVYAHTATIENSGEERFKAVRLSAQVVNLANHDLSDLRLYDADGEEVPYTIRSLYDTEDTADLTPPFTVEDGDKKSYVRIEGLQNLRLASITIEIFNIVIVAVAVLLGVVILLRLRKKEQEAS